MSLYELFIGLRYLKTKKSQGFISFNTVLSILIVFIGVFMLIVVISVYSGFQSQIKDKILDVDSHITVIKLFSRETGEGIGNYQGVMEQIKKIKGVKSVTPFVQGEALFRAKNFIRPIALRGMGDKNFMPPDVEKFIRTGPKKFSSNNDVYIGTEMSWDYDVQIGDYIELIVPKGRLTTATGITPGLGAYRVAGFFKTGYYEFDTKLVVMSLPAAQNLYSIGNTIWGLGVKIDDVYRMDAMAEEIRTKIGYKFQTLTAEERNQNLFYALRLEKLIMTVILFLVIISASFTIMGTLVMVVMEKRKAIGVLKSMGAKPISIMIIFVMEGFLIGLFGSALGVIFGVATSLNFEAIIRWIEASINSIGKSVYALLYPSLMFPSVSLVPKNIYYIDTIPTQVNPEFVVFIAIFAVFLSTVAAIFPSWHASRLNPVETIRYE